MRGGDKFMGFFRKLFGDNRGEKERVLQEAAEKAEERRKAERREAERIEMERREAERREAERREIPVRVRRDNAPAVSSVGNASGQERKQFEPRRNNFRNGPIGGDLSMQSIHRSGTKVIVDRSAILAAGFVEFVKAYCDSRPNPNRFLFVPGFGMKDLGDRAPIMEALMHQRICIAWEGGNDYTALFEKRATLAPFLVVLNDGTAAEGLRMAAEKAKIQIRLVHLMDNGQLKALFVPAQRPKSEVPAADSFVISTEFARFPFARMPHARVGIGSSVNTSSGRRIRLGSEIAHNENSITYQIEGERLYAKVFAEDKLTTLDRYKVERMLSKNIAFSGLCWPQEAVRDANGRFIGYTMPAFSGKPLSHCVFQPDELRKSFPSWGRAQLSRLGETIMNKINYMHCRGILFGSIEPASIWVRDEKEVYFLDTDRYQIEGFPCMKYSYAFCAPEVIDKAGKIRLVTLEEERFAVAELAFEIIMLGKSAYPTENGSESLQNIREMQFGYSWGDNKGASDERRKVGKWRFVWSHLSPKLKESFYRTFMESKLKYNPEARRNAYQWAHQFASYAEELESDSLFDKDSRKLFPPSFKRSPKDRFVRCQCCGVEHPDWYFRKDFLEAGYAYCRACLRKASDDGFTCKHCGKHYIYTYETSIFHKIRRETDEWKAQKWCANCKGKKARCKSCGAEMSITKLREDGTCNDCHKKWLEGIYETRICKNSYCGSRFIITNGEAEFLRKKGFNLPTKCKCCRGK